MGNSTGSTMYMFGAVIVIYIAGMLLYQGIAQFDLYKQLVYTKKGLTKS